MYTSDQKNLLIFIDRNQIRENSTQKKTRTLAKLYGFENSTKIENKYLKDKQIFKTHEAASFLCSDIGTLYSCSHNLLLHSVANRTEEIRV